MKKNSSDHEPTFGFVTITHDDAVGHIGGYLLLNARARPLEFHCTAPVQPSRAQEILYGAILKSYLYGEQIAGALFDRAKMLPDLLLSDVMEIAESRPLADVPTFQLLPAEPPAIGSHVAGDGGLDQPTGVHRTAKWHTFRLGEYQLSLPSCFATDQHVAEELWHTWADGMALDEPFVRIREAVQEAQRPAKAS